MDAEFKKLLNGGIWALNAPDNKDPDSTDITPSLTRADGFPSIYSQQVGGVRPDRRRINQLLRELSGAAFEVRMGVSPYDAEVNYPVDAISQVEGNLFRAITANGPSSTVVGPTDAGQTAWERVTGATTEPEAPRDILFDNSVPNSMDVRWKNGRDGGSRIVRYDFQYRLHNDAQPNIWSPASPLEIGYAQYTINALRSGDQIQVRVRAYTLAGDISPWFVSTVSDEQDSNDRVRGNVPSGGDLFGLTARQVGTNAALDWTAVSGNGFPINRYIVQWRTESTQFSASNQTTTTGSITQATITGLSLADVKYFFRVTAENSQGQGPWSNIAELTMRQLNVRVQPTLNAPTITSSNTSSFTASSNWSNNADTPTATPTSAEWWVRDTLGGSWTKEPYTGLTGFNRTGLTANRRYEVRYRLTTSLGLTGYSPVSTVNTQSPVVVAPGAPSSISVSLGTRSGSPSAQNVFVNWGAARENGYPVTGYDIRWTWSGRSLQQGAGRNSRSSSALLTGPPGTRVTVYVNASTNSVTGPSRSASITLT